MKTTVKHLFSEDTILEFHIGRGGRFYNGGHLSFVVSDRRIDQTGAYNHLFLPENEENNPKAEFLDDNGNGVGLTVSESQSGVGRIDLDGEYDTTYCVKISDLNEEELRAVVRDTSGWECREIMAATGCYDDLSILLADQFDKYSELISGDEMTDYFSTCDEEPEGSEFLAYNKKYYVIND